MVDSKFKRGDKVLVEATVAGDYSHLGHDYLLLELEGRSDITTVETSIVRPVELDVDKVFGGPPGGTVEVGRARWLELDESKRAMIRTFWSDFGGEAGGESSRYFEVISRG